MASQDSPILYYAQYSLDGFYIKCIPALRARSVSSAARWLILVKQHFQLKLLELFTNTRVLANRYCRRADLQILQVAKTPILSVGLVFFPFEFPVFSRLHEVPIDFPTKIVFVQKGKLLKFSDACEYNLICERGINLNQKRM